MVGTSRQLRQRMALEPFFWIGWRSETRIPHPQHSLCRARVRVLHHRRANYQPYQCVMVPVLSRYPVLISICMFMRPKRLGGG